MKILVGHAGSDSSEDALLLAKQHAIAFQGSVMVAMALRENQASQADVVDQAKIDLAKAEAMFKEFGIPCETRLLANRLMPGENIVTLAREEAVSEIIIGLRRRSKLGKLLFGENVQYVIVNAPCPVVIVK